MNTLTARALLTASLLSACNHTEKPPPIDLTRNVAMLVARPFAPKEKPATGLQPLGLSTGPRDGFIYIPP
ncbi:MAG TPA: hypothetical protein VJL35_11565, partial [Gemmatimonadaceae bacterium]|nr:hypothetical protein [Gemmatimonadaceae bacterium]